MRVTGYLDGVAYTLETDPTVTPDEMRGIVTSVSPLEVLVHLWPYVGEPVPVTSVGPDIVGSFDNDKALLAMLRCYTEVVATAGAPDLIEADDAEPMIH